MGKMSGEFKTNLENIDQVEVEYNFDEDGHVEITSVDKKAGDNGQWLYLLDALNESAKDSVMERCIEHMPQAKAEYDECLRERELGL